MAEKQTVARPYAKAIFGLAQEQEQLDLWSESLRMLALITTDPKMSQLLTNPGMDRDQLIELITSITGAPLHAGAQNLLKVLAEHGRLSLLPEIATLFEHELAAVTGRLEAEVISATELNQAQRNKIAESLSKRFSRSVTLNCSVDASIIGGAIIRAGDIVIDGSVTARLEKLTAALSH